MSERTLKAAGWQPQSRPAEDAEIRAYRQLIIEAIYGIYYSKKERLAAKQMPPQPVTLQEIFDRVKSMVNERRSTGDWPFGVHEKRYVDRRVNEVATAKYAVGGVPKVVAVRAGLYEPNKVCFLFHKDTEVQRF